MTVAAEYRHHNRTNRASFDPRDQIVAGRCRQQRRGRAESPLGRSRHARRDDVRQRQRAARTRRRRASSTRSAATAAARRTAPGFYRRALDARNWPQIYPLGFLPVIEPTVVDASGTAGVRGVCERLDLRRQRRVRAQQLRLHDRQHAERVARPDDAAEQDRVRRRHARARTSSSATSTSAAPFNVDGARGTAERGVRRRVSPRELPDPRRRAGLLRRRRRRRTSSAASPRSARRCSPASGRRTRWTSRATASPATSTSKATVLKWLRLGLAGRAEHYSDFGSTVDGKLTVRVQPDPPVRRPRLGQHRLPRPVARPVVLLVDGDELRQPRAGARAGRVADAARSTPRRRRCSAPQPLKPENSPHASARRRASRPLPGLDITVDYYRIAIDDRIVLSGNFTAAADRGAARAVRRQQRAVLHQRDRHADQRRRRDGQLPHRARRRPATCGCAPATTTRGRRSSARSPRRRSSPASSRCCSIASSGAASSAASRRTACGSAATGGAAGCGVNRQRSPATASSAASR